MDAHAAAHPEHAEHKHHVVPVAVFTKVFVILMILTAITVSSSRVDFGAMNMLIALCIASVKAALVMTFFMHLKYDTAMNQIAILSSFLFLSLLFLFTIGDLETRKKTDAVNGKPAEMSTEKLREYDSWLMDAVKKHK